MAVDIREQILARVFEVISDIPGIRSAHRNDGDIPEDSLPAAILFDGDEEVVNGETRKLGRPTPVHMTPEIVIAERTVGQIGSALTPLRRALITGVLVDAQLEQIVNPPGGGGVRYLGCQTDIGWMRSMHGALRAQFLFTYNLKPEDL